MNEKFLNYPDWQDTCDTLHMLFQIAGKIKLERSDPRPEWAHIRLYLIIDGLTTGLLPGEETPFEILFNLRKHRIVFRNGKGKKEKIPLKNGIPVSSYFRQMTEALIRIGAPTVINTRPQEFYDPIDFDRDEKHRSYDENAASLFLHNLYFAYQALNKFVSPFRGKVDYPAYYFGTMDLSASVYSGEPEPFAKPQAVISSRAFDERNYEVGFWPGDNRSPYPSFYALPYPFITDIERNDHLLRPDKAIFSSEKKEFFLTLADALSEPDPIKAVTDFLQSGFEIVQKLKRWERLDWITHPLTYSHP